MKFKKEIRFQQQPTNQSLIKTLVLSSQKHISVFGVCFLFSQLWPLCNTLPTPSFPWFPHANPILTERVHELVAALGLVRAIDHGHGHGHGHGHAAGGGLVVGGGRALLLAVAAGAVVSAPGATARVWGTAAAAAAHLLNHLHLRTQLWETGSLQRVNWPHNVYYKVINLQYPIGADMPIC